MNRQGERIKIVRNKLESTLGITMLELMVVVGIIGILAAVGFIAVANYQRSLGQLERDGIAKEIFVAAQNHLTAAYGEGYFAKEEENYFGNPETKDGKKNGVYYFVINGTIDDTTLMGQMLPFGSIDETVRMGGSYIIRYQKDTALVLDVFYCTRSGSPEQFNHKFVDNDYSTVLEMRDVEEDNKAARRDWEDAKGAILGWYGGAGLAELASELKSPTITVTNAEKLSVTVTDPNGASYTNGTGLKLIIKGLSSGAKKVISLPSSDGTAGADNIYTYTVVLDDITTSGKHFADIFASSDNSYAFVPGENIKIKAVSYNNTVLSNIAYSGEQITNSLFGSISDEDQIKDKKFETAHINNIRHLENLDKIVSGLGNTEDPNATYNGSEKFNISKAVQASNVSWTAFQKKITKSGKVVIYPKSGTATEAGYYYPVSPDYALSYNGQNYSVSDISVNFAQAAGLFGAPEGTLSVNNLQLVDFSITSTRGDAGALVGTLGTSGGSVKNVIAYNTKTGTEAPTGISAATCAGGLIGSMSSGSVTASGAALTVNGNNSAGGLIGTVSDGFAPEISYCLSGGHTEEGEGMYSNTAYNVTAASTGTAGGLIGVAANANITYSYSTCSVKSENGINGGFVGSTKGSIDYCYCTGLVHGEGNNAFVGSNNGTISNSQYYEIINEMVDANGEITYKGPGVDSGVTALDASAEVFNTFSQSDAKWSVANAYDSELRKYYAGKYCLKTVQQLGNTWPTEDDASSYSWSASGTKIVPFVSAHYGDWPAPELFIINTKQVINTLD